MEKEDYRKRYVHLLNLIWDYRVKEKHFEDSRSSLDRKSMQGRRNALDAFLKKEKELHDAQQDKKELF